MTERQIKAMENFKGGCNCAQAVLLAFEDELSLSRDEILKLTSSFGMGMGGLREVCGAVSAVFMLIGLKKGSSDLDAQKKREHYALIREIGGRLKNDNGSIVCGELLSMAKQQPAEGENLFKRKSCVELVGHATGVAEEYLNKI